MCADKTALNSQAEKRHIIDYLADLVEVGETKDAQHTAEPDFENMPVMASRR